MSPPGISWLVSGPGALASPSKSHREDQAPECQAHNLCGQVSNWGACQVCCKNDEWLSHFQGSGWFRELLAGTLLPACQPVNYFQLYLSCQHFLTNWPLSFYSTTMSNAPFLGMPQGFLPFSASSYPEWNEELWRDYWEEAAVKGRADRLKPKLVFLYLDSKQSWFLGFWMSTSSDSVYHVDKAEKQKKKWGGT